MADLFSIWGQDLVASAGGDLLTVDGSAYGQQRVLRRLMTNPGDYIWEPTYGAGLPSYVGSALDVKAITALIRLQLSLESAVAQNPLPVIDVTHFAGGLSVNIVYVDADTGVQVNLSFDVSK